jgi:hypothetical protein
MKDIELSIVQRERWIDIDKKRYYTQSGALLRPIVTGEVNLACGNRITKDRGCRRAVLSPR